MAEPNTGNPAGDPIVKGFELPEKPSITGEFERVEKLASKLAKVPKTGLDEQREKKS